MSEARYYETAYVEVIHLLNHTKPYPEHNHISVFALGAILGGELMLQRQKQKTVVSKGMVFVIPPYEVHALEPLGKVDMLSMCIHQDIVRREANTALMDAIGNLLLLLADMQIVSQAQRLPLLRAIYDLLLVGKERPSLCCEYVAQVRNLIEQQPNETMRVESLAKEVHICKDHLIRRFKSEIGLTPHKFQLQNRIRMAQRLIGQGMPITEVAQATGFYDQSHFDKQFHYLMGISPIGYKKAVYNNRAFSKALA